MDIESIVKMSSDLTALKKEIQSDKMAQAVLLLSKDGVYATAFARELAAAIFENGGKATVHSQKVEMQSHPDLKIYPLDSGKLLVSDSESIASESFIKPIFSDKKVFIIENIDNSMEAAQNKLLKVLEEPPAHVFYILTCTNEQQVLPTIRSRCNKVVLVKPDFAIVKELLQGEENGEIAASLCDGYVGRAVELLKVKKLSELFWAALDNITKLSSSRELLKFSKPLISRAGDFELIVQIMALALEDMLFIKIGRQEKVHLKIAADILDKASEKYSVMAICEISKLLTKAAKEHFYSGNFTLILENLLLDILEVKYICK